VLDGINSTEFQRLRDPHWFVEDSTHVLSVHNFTNFMLCVYSCGTSFVSSFKE
jgi:hypothetical protein